MALTDQTDISEVTIIRKKGATKTVGAETPIVDSVDSSNNITESHGTVVPTNGTAGYAKSALFRKTDAADGTQGLYENIGTTASSNFNLIGAISAGEISLADTHILVGNALGKAADVAMSGDATMADTGALTIANSAVTPLKQSTAARTCTAMIEISPLPAPTGADQLNIDRLLMNAPQAITVVSAQLVTDVVTVGSDVTNHYEFVLRNTDAAVNLGSTVLNTFGGELAAELSLNALITDQNLAVTSGQRLVLRTSIKDDGGAGPTNLSTAVLRVQITYII